jgi:hypothetical protein
MIWMKGRKVRLGTLILAVFLMASLMLALPGCFGGDPSVEELWQKSQEADKDINSFHMEVAILYENTKFGGGQIQTYTYDVNGNNVHATGAIFGTSFSEIIVVGGKEYSRMAGGQEWTEQAVSFDRQSVSDQVESFAALPSIASSSQNLGVENLGGSEVYHLNFSLSAQELGELFKNVQPSQLSSSTGGEVDVWVEKETNYRVKYEALVRNALIDDPVGYGDIRLTINITNINQPINITAPI